MSLRTAAVAPIERVTVPLRPRTPAGCCDLAVMFYGRHAGPLLRLYLAVAGPVIACVYGLGRFAGTGLAVALVAALIVSKPLGALTVAAAVRATFGEALERPSRRGARSRTLSGRLGETARGMVTAAAVLTAIALVAAIVDDAYGTGRVAAFGAAPAAVMVLVATSVLMLRATIFIIERAAPGRTFLIGLMQGTLVRLLFAGPLLLLFFEETRTAGIVVACVWLPIVAWLMLLRSFRTERRALTAIDPALHTSHSDKALEFSETIGPGIVIATVAAGLTLVALSAIEFAVTVAGLPGTISGPVGDSFDAEFFELDYATAALARSPLFSTALLAAGLFAFQIGRLAWYFVYVDARVRRDCWDMELLLAREATRLEDAG